MYWEPFKNGYFAINHHSMCINYEIHVRELLSDRTNHTFKSQSNHQCITTKIKINNDYDDSDIYRFLGVKVLQPSIVSSHERSCAPSHNSPLDDVIDDVMTNCWWRSHQKVVMTELIGKNGNLTSFWQCFDKLLRSKIFSVKWQTSFKVNPIDFAPIF